MRKVAHHRITGLLRAVSGLRIGGSDDMLEIGGTDLTCIKHPETLAPYVPGSSLKGRMRSELESHLNLIRGAEPFQPRGKRLSDLANGSEYLVATVFGPHRTTGHDFGPTRIICRDSAVCTDYRLELKSEVMSDRKTGTGQHPRKFERVASGAGFAIKLDVHVLDLDADNQHGKCVFAGKTGWDAMFEFLKLGLRLVELSGLGSGVSRGSGEVLFEDLKLDGASFTLADVDVGAAAR